MGGKIRYTNTEETRKKGKEEEGEKYKGKLFREDRSPANEQRDQAPL